MMDTNYKILDRTTPPAIRSMENFQLARPERLRMKNGMPLHVIRAGSQEVVRLDVLIGGGQWHQTQALQALFTNRMLREGTLSLTSKQIAEKLDYYGAWLAMKPGPTRKGGFLLRVSALKDEIFMVFSKSCCAGKNDMV